MTFLTRVNFWIVTACVLSASAILCSTASASAYKAAVLADNPVAYWRLGDSGTVAVDQVGNNNGEYRDDAVVGVTPSATADGDTAATFNNGSAQVVVSPTHDSINMGTVNGQPQGTIEVWFKWDGSMSRRALVSNRPDCGHPCQDQSNYQFYLREGNATSYNGNSSAEMNWGHAATPNQWTHYVFTIDDDTSTGTLYVNGGTAAGGSEHQATGIQFGSHGDKPDPDIFRIGRFPHSGTNEPFSGDIDEVAIYRGILSADRIAAHFNAASIPEPVSIVLLSSGILGMVCLRRRQG